MNPIPPGPLSKLDAAALRTVSKVHRVSTLPTYSLLAAGWAYVVTLIVVGVAIPFYPAPGMRKVLASLPLLTLLLLVGVTYFVYRASDEYQRLRILKCAAITGVLLAFGTTGYFCLEQLGYPHLSVIIVNLCGWSIFLILMLWVRSSAQ